MSDNSNTPSNNGDFAAGVPLAPLAGGNPEGKELSDPVDVVIDKLLR